MKTIIKGVAALFLLLFFCSCASLGTKTIYNAGVNETVNRISKVYIVKPNLVNIDFYENSTSDFYFQELDQIFKEYNISVIKADTIISDFDIISPNTELNIPSASDCDYILLGKITRLTAMGMTRDFKVEYKLVNPKDNKLKYHSSYSTTFGKTYVILPGSGLPSEEQLMRDAIKLGFQNIKKDVLSK